MAQKKTSYLMENSEEALRLELKTDPEAVRSQANWCGVEPGMSVLDAGCGPGKVTSILYKMIQPRAELSWVSITPKNESSTQRSTTETIRASSSGSMTSAIRLKPWAPLT